MPKLPHIRDRLKDKLHYKTISLIRPALLGYLLDNALDPAKVRCNMDFVKNFIPDFADSDPSWLDLDEDLIVSTKPAIKSLLDHLTGYFVSDQKLHIDLKEAK